MSKAIARFRAAAYHRQHGRCCYCNALTWLSDVQRFAKAHSMRQRRARLFRATAEHLVALCEEGNTTAGNIAAACWYCNVHRHRRKKAPSPGAYKFHVQTRLAHGRWNLAGNNDKGDKGVR